MKNKASIYEFDSYKKIMGSYLLSEGQRGQMSRAAEHLQCQPSFLSRVISSETHLTPDQAFLLSQFWGLDNHERDYFQLLVELDRAAAPRYKSHISEKIKALKKNHESFQKITKKPDFPLLEQQALYFSSWQWSAIHFLTCITEYQSPKQIASRLGLNEIFVINFLKQLESFGLIKEVGKRWVYEQGQFHLPKNSPFVTNHHQNWRTRAVLDSQFSDSEGLHYTSVLTLSKSDFDRLKEIFLNFISDSERIARPSEPEEVVALTCDLFKI